MEISLLPLHSPEILLGVLKQNSEGNSYSESKVLKFLQDIRISSVGKMTKKWLISEITIPYFPFYHT